MPTIFNVTTEDKQVPATAKDPATIINMNGGAVHYGETRYEPGPEGLEPGESVTVERPQWVSVDPPAKVQVLRNEDK
jgi:hypothetical protein